MKRRRKSKVISPSSSLLASFWYWNTAPLVSFTICKLENFEALRAHWLIECRCLCQIATSDVDVYECSYANVLATSV
jgi:hypothetical protein